MKKLPVYLFMLSMLILPALAIGANIYEASDFTKHPEQMVVLQERDLIKLNWADKEHKLMVRAVYPDKNKVDLTAFIEGSEVPYYATINPKTSLQLDFDRDDVFDLKISLFNIIEDNGEKIVALKLESLRPESLDIATTEGIAGKEQNKSYTSILQAKSYLLTGIIILAGIGVWKRKLVIKAFRRTKTNRTKKE